MLVSLIDCFECLFTCLGKKSLLTEELFLYNIRYKYVKKWKNKNILHLKILKMSDKMNLTHFNTVESTLYLKNKSGKRWKRKTALEQPNFQYICHNNWQIQNVSEPYLEMFYFEDIGLCKLQLE